MAYPVLPGTAHVQVVMQHVSGLPADVFVNNFYFDPDPVALTVPEAWDQGIMQRMLDAFYNEAHGTTRSIANFLTADIVSVTYKCYDLGEETPRYPLDPVYTAPWAGGGSGTLPQEVALCLSFRSGNGPRRKGRVYLGPFAPIAENDGRPDDGLREVMAAAAVDMINSAENCDWNQVSPTAADKAGVSGGWVDNAWDTQRSRGLAPTNRYTYDTGGVTPPA